MGILSSGASSRTLMSRMPMRLMWRVLGMGVAVRVSTSTFSFSFLIFSLCCTPNLCSSSMMRSPKSLYFRSSLRTRWVPMMMSTSPLFVSSMVFFCWAGVRNRHIRSTRTGNSFIRWTKVL